MTIFETITRECSPGAPIGAPGLATFSKSPALPEIGGR
jgi:hypothetical protein